MTGVRDPAATYSSWSGNREQCPTENNVHMLPFRRAGVLSEFMQLKYFFLLRISAAILLRSFTNEEQKKNEVGL